MRVREEHISISLDTIYNEIINMAASVGECKSSIEYVSYDVEKLHNDFRYHIDAVREKVEALEKFEIERQHRAKLFLGIIQFSPGAIFKWAIAVILAIFLLGSSVKEDMINKVKSYYEQLLT